MAPIYATDSEGDSSDDDDNGNEDGAMGGDVFEDGIRLSREEDGGTDESMASAFRDLRMIDPRRKKIK